MCRDLGLSTKRVLRLARVSALGPRPSGRLAERPHLGHLRGEPRVYGRPRIHAELKEKGERVGANRVGRLMRVLEIQGASRRRRKPGTMRREPQVRPVADFVERVFTADGPDWLWVADITYIFPLLLLEQGSMCRLV